MNQLGRSSLSEASEKRPSVALPDMDTVQEENDSDSEESHVRLEHIRGMTSAMVEPAAEGYKKSQSQPNSRRVSHDIDAKSTLNPNIRRPSALFSAFRRPSQALALCAATQKKFLSELGPNSHTSLNSIHEHQPSAAELYGYDALTKALSALYAKLLVVLGLAFPVTEVISTGVSNNIYEGFYLYLYTVSVIFIIVQYVNIFRHSTEKDINCNDEDDKNERNDKATPLTEKPKRKKNISRYGSFYLRLGAIAFGIGSMVYSGLKFGEYFEKDEDCRYIMSILTPAVRMTLTLLQMQFIFLTNEEIETGGHIRIQRFGFMHILATNICEWLHVLVAETEHEIHHSKEYNRAMNHTHAHADLNCSKTQIMKNTLQNAAPFLFPCTIEYSLICAVIFYEMWKELKFTTEDLEKKIIMHHAKTKPRRSSVSAEKILHQFASMMGVGSPYGSKTALHNFSIDCSHTHRGLFGGILIIVMTIISLIMFFVLANYSRIDEAIFQVVICELILYSLALIASLMALKQMRRLPYKRKSESVLVLDTSLLVLAQSGMFVYCMFSMIGCHHIIYYKNDNSAITGFFSELLSLIQTIVQSLFIIDAWWRRSTTSAERKQKPGRQLVTFLLVANMAMWAINTLEKNRAEFRPDHLKFYGDSAWTIITHVSMPLAIFYRFHSTICLFEVWKNSFTKRPLYFGL